MEFPGLDELTVTPLVAHAVFVLREAMPADCTSMTVEFDEQGAALTVGYRSNGVASESDIVLAEDALAAAGMLLTSISYQVITLSRMHEKQGDEAVETVLKRFAASLSEAGLSVGLLDESLADTLTISF